MHATTSCLSIAAVISIVPTTLLGSHGTHDKGQQIEEPYEGKLSRTVLKPSGEGDLAA